MAHGPWVVGCQVALSASVLKLVDTPSSGCCSARESDGERGTWKSISCLVLSSVAIHPVNFSRPIPIDFFFIRSCTSSHVRVEGDYDYLGPTCPII